MPTGFNNTPDAGQQLLDNAFGGNLSGIISTRPSAKYMSGARCIIKINGKPVAFAFGIQWRIDTLFTEVTAIDNPLAEELVPKAIKVAGTISALHIPGQGAGMQLWQADVLSFLFHQYLTIEVRDQTTNALLFFASKAVISSRSEDIKVDELAQVSLSFQAIGFRDEKTPEVPSKALTQKNELKKVGDLHTEPKDIGDFNSGLISDLA